MKSGSEFSLALISSLPSPAPAAKPLAVLAEEIWQSGLSVPENLPADLWTGCLNIDFGACEQDAWQYLSAAEADRARRILNKDDAATYVLVHAMLRLLLSRRLNIHPAKLAFETGMKGKPSLVTAEPLHFNISYRKGVFAIALGKSPVGVDIELNQSTIDTAGIARNFFSANENSFLQQFGGSQEANDQFFRIWSCKEAVVKLFGRGIDDFGQFDVNENFRQISKSPWSDENYYCLPLAAPFSCALAMAFSLERDFSVTGI